MAIENIPVGFPRALVWKAMAAGYMGGIAGDTLAGSSVSGAYAFDAQSADYAIAEPEMLTVDDGDLRKLQIAVSGRPANPFTITDADFDYDLFVMGTGGAVDNSNTPYRRMNRNAEKIDLPPMGCAIQQRLFDPGAGPGSSFKWITEIFPLVTLAPARTSATQRQHSPTAHRVTPFPAKKDLTGETFSESLKMKTTRGRLDSYTLISDNPIHFAVYKVVGTAASTFTLPYLPLSSVVTLGASPNEVWRNGVREAATTVVPATGSITCAAGVTDDILVVIYTTNYVPSV